MRTLKGMTCALAACAVAVACSKKKSDDPPPTPANKPVEPTDTPPPVAHGDSSIEGSAITLGSNAYRVGAVLKSPRFDGEGRLLGLRGDTLVAVDAATGAVTDVATIPGAQTLGGGPDGTILVGGDGVSFVDAKGAVSRKLPVDAGVVTAVSATADGKQLLLSGYQGAIVLVDASTGAEVERVPAGEEGFSDVVFSHGETRLVARQGESIVGLGRADGVASRMPVSGGTWALGPAYLATVAGGNPFDGYDVDIWNDVTGALVVGIHRERGVRALAWLPDGKTIVIGGDDGSVERYKIVDNAATPAGAPVELHGGAIAALAISPSGMRVAAITAHGTVHFVDGDKVSDPGTGHRGAVERLAFSGEFLISGGADETIWTWELSGSRRTTKIDLAGDLMAMTPAPDGQGVYAQVDVYARPTSENEPSFARHMIEAYTLSGDRKSGDELEQGADGLKYCPLRKAIQVVTGQYWKEIDPTTFDVSARNRSTGSRGRLGPNGQFAAFEGHGALIVVDDAETRRLGTAQCSRVEGVAFDPSGKVAAMTDGTNAIRLWQIHGDLVAGVSVAGAAAAGDGVVLPDQHTAMFTMPGGLLIWDQAANTAGKIALDAPARTIALAPEGDRVAIGFEDGRIAVFDLAALRARSTPLDTGPAAELTDDDCHKLDPDAYASAFSESPTRRFGDPGANAPNIK